MKGIKQIKNLVKLQLDRIPQQLVDRGVTLHLGRGLAPSLASGLSRQLPGEDSANNEMTGTNA